jgi:hypothetical protein
MCFGDGVAYLIAPELRLNYGNPGVQRVKGSSICAFLHLAIKERMYCMNGPRSGPSKVLNMVARGNSLHTQSFYASMLCFTSPLLSESEGLDKN